jgi:hypothetical protein
MLFLFINPRNININVKKLHTRLVQFWVDLMLMLMLMLRLKTLNKFLILRKTASIIKRLFAIFKGKQKLKCLLSALNLKDMGSIFQNVLTMFDKDGSLV